MKKLLQLAAVIALTFCTVESKAQLADGSTAQNFTFTDMNGNTQDLYTYLNAGKVVVIDVSATWCNPCWNYHNSGNLENFYNTYGPSGTNQAMVLFIEGDGATNDACMTNSAGCTGGTSQGNWVSGTPYPMCNPASAMITPFNTNYAIAYFPTMYMICPDKKTTKVDQFTTANLAAAMNATCPPPTAVNDAGINAVTSPSPFVCGTTFIPVVTLRNFGSSTLTSCTVNYKIDSNTPQTYPWTGSLAAGTSIYSTTGITTITLPAMTVALGNHTFTVYSSSPNGTTDGNTANDTKTLSFAAVTPTTSPVAEGMESTFPSSVCAVVNPDNSTTWTKSAPGGFGTSSNSAKMDCYNYAASGAVDYLLLTPMNFSSSATPALTFNVAYAPYDATYFEQLDVEASTDCGTTWTNVYSKSGSTLGTVAATTTAFTPTAAQWRAETVSLNSYAGQASVMVRFKCTNNYGNNMYVDDINLSAASSVNDFDLSSSISVYPNPSSGNVFVNINLPGPVSADLKVTNLMGETVLESKNNSQSTIKLDLSKVSGGMYFVEVRSENAKTTKKIILNK